MDSPTRLGTDPHHHDDPDPKNEDLTNTGGPTYAHIAAATVLAIVLWFLSDRISLVTGMDPWKVGILLGSLAMLMTGEVIWETVLHEFKPLSTPRRVMSGLILALVAGVVIGMFGWASVLAQGDPIQTWHILDQLRVVSTLCLIPLAIVWMLIGSPKDKGPGSRHLASTALLLGGWYAVTNFTTLWTWLWIVIAWSLLAIPVWRTHFDERPPGKKSGKG